MSGAPPRALVPHPDRSSREDLGELRQRLFQARLWLFEQSAYGLLLAESMSSVGTSSVAFWVTSAIAAALAVVVLVVSGLPARRFGLSWRRPGRALVSALLSAGLLLLLGLTPALLLRAASSAGAAGLWFSLGVDPELWAYVAISTPLQELIFRGVFQSSARYILGGVRGATALAVAFSTLAYAASHLPWGAGAALAAIAPGVVWGVQFERDETLLGVVVSHAIVGYVFVVATPVWGLLGAASP